ncbi:hypothetical protein B0H16DRAFT_1470015 [Mycena metata]|uniref:Uncharacterized protein n=1 Tax=Mycena metata TaxID=1033252 RepID=A0AAD7HVQ9_9AGAR|nr:hypothetical protein B0H16DRAFT_1470015 [Mycena metata]
MPLALEGPFVAPPSLPETREIGLDLRPSQHLPTSQPPVYTPSDSFLPPSTDITPAYTSFFEKLNPKPAGEPDPTDYTSFWTKKSAPKPIPKPSERTSFSQNSVPSSQRPTTTTSHPVSAANVARNDPRSFGSNSTNIDFSSFGKFTTSEDYVVELTGMAFGARPFEAGRHERGAQKRAGKSDRRPKNSLKIDWARAAELSKHSVHEVGGAELLCKQGSSDNLTTRNWRELEGIGTLMPFLPSTHQEKTLSYGSYRRLQIITLPSLEAFFQMEVEDEVHALHEYFSECSIRDKTT